MILYIPYLTIDFNESESDSERVLFMDGPRLSVDYQFQLLVQKWGYILHNVI